MLNIRVMVIPVVIGAAGMVRKVLEVLEKRHEEMGIRERIETIQTTVLLRSV